MKKIIVTILILLTLIVSSCVVQKKQYGSYANQQGKEVVYDKGKDIYLFWDQVQLQKVDKNVNATDYEKVVKRNVFDALITYGTMGIVSYYSVKITIKESEQKEKE